MFKTIELNAVLDWINELNEVDTNGIEPLANITGHTLPLRKDKVSDGGYSDEILKIASKYSKNQQF